MSKWLETLEKNELKPRAEALGEAVSQRLNSAQKLQAYIKARLETVFLVELLEKTIQTMPACTDLHRVLVENLAEEQGQHAEYGSLDHATSRQQLATSMGVRLQSCITPEVQNVLANQSATFWLGMLTYIEYTVPTEYGRLRTLIEPFFPAADMSHLDDHIEHDICHFADLYQTLSQENDLDKSTFLAGVKFVHRQRMGLLRALEDSLGDSR